jgi:hypothetical protein
MNVKFKEILDKYIVEEVDIKLPKLEKQQLKLPKLKKVEA